MKKSRTYIAGVLASSLVVAVMAASSASAAPPTPACLAPPGSRIDLATPKFSNPTNITNPLFPVEKGGQKLQLGIEAGEPVRFETTPLRATKLIRWNNQDVQTRVVQFVAYTSDRIAETAVDFYAQDDAGNVWYFGEDVYNYERGVIVNTKGTWRAGKDGPPGMIMPANPKLGDVYRPENIPGFAFEEVTVKATNQTVAGPKGPVAGAIFVQECLADGVLEDKTFAPGYGEFKFSVPVKAEVAQVALSVPIDALKGPAPAALAAVADDAGKLFRTAETKRWAELDRTVKAIERSWAKYKGGTQVPERLATQVELALKVMAKAIREKNTRELRQAAIDVAQAGLDIELRYRVPAEVDKDRIAVWRQQLVHDQATGDAGNVKSDKATIEAIRARMKK